MELPSCKRLQRQLSSFDLSCEQITDKMLMVETSVTFIIFVEVFPRFSPCFFGPHLTIHDLLCFVASPISH